jgi:hypothetical protein
MRKHYTGQQKAQCVLELLKEEKTVAPIASEHGMHPNSFTIGKPRPFKVCHACSKMTTRQRKCSSI